MPHRRSQFRGCNFSLVSFVSVHFSLDFVQFGRLRCKIHWIHSSTICQEVKSQPALRTYQYPKWAKQPILSVVIPLWQHSFKGRHKFSFDSEVLCCESMCALVSTVQFHKCVL
eukprot:scpid91987/ scgid18137/ 